CRPPSFLLLSLAPGYATPPRRARDRPHARFGSRTPRLMCLVRTCKSPARTRAILRWTCGGPDRAARGARAYYQRNVTHRRDIGVTSIPYRELLSPISPPAPGSLLPPEPRLPDAKLGLRLFARHGARVPARLPHEVQVHVFDRVEATGQHRVGLTLDDRPERTHRRGERHVDDHARA